MEGVNILNLFKSNTTADKPNPNNSLTNSSSTTNAGNQNSQGDVKKPVLGASTLPSTLATAPAGTTANTSRGVVATSASTPGSGGDAVPESKVVSMFASPADYLAYLTKRQ